jgi:hypothetical protein
MRRAHFYLCICAQKCIDRAPAARQYISYQIMYTKLSPNFRFIVVCRLFLVHTFSIGDGSHGKRKPVITPAQPLQIITHRTRGGGGTVSHSANRKAELKTSGRAEEKRGRRGRGKKIDAHTPEFSPAANKHLSGEQQPLFILLL